MLKLDDTDGIRIDTTRKGYRRDNLYVKISRSNDIKH